MILYFYQLVLFLKILLLKKLKIDINSEILGPKVVDFKTSIDGFFACGNIIYGENALHMKETDGIECGIKAAEYIKKYHILKIG